MQTVSGERFISAEGVILPHEHLFIDLRFIGLSAPGSDRLLSLSTLHQARFDYTSITDNLHLDSLSTAVTELTRFSAAGGQAIVDVSSIGAGRQPELLLRLAEETDIAIVMGTGFYVRAALPDAVIGKKEAELSRIIIDECERGTVEGGMGKPGIIGEVGVGPELDSWDRKSLRAATVAQRETGLPLSIHIQAVPTTDGYAAPNGLEVIALLEQAGADLSNTVIGHADARINMDYIRSLLAAGVYVEFDHFGKDFYFPETNFLMSRDADRVQAISKFVDEGYTDRLLLSTDICLKTDLTAYGGHGYSHIAERIIPMMIRNGLSPETVKQLTRDNVLRLLGDGNRKEQ